MEIMECSLDDINELKRRYFTGKVHLAYSGISTCGSGHSWNERRSFYIIHIILRGKGTLMKGKKLWRLHAGQAFGLYPGESYVYTADIQKPWKYCWVGFQGSEAEKIMCEIGFSRDNPAIRLTSVSRYSEVIREIAEYRGFGYGDEMHRTGLLMGLLADMMDGKAEDAPQKIAVPGAMQERGEAEPESSGYAREYINGAIAYMQEHYGENISIALLAKRMGISRCYLAHIFQAEEKQSPQQCLIRIRMEHAEAMLIGGEKLSIRAIALRCGYRDEMTFSRAFRRRCGMSPSQFRRLRAKQDHVQESSGGGAR